MDDSGEDVIRIGMDICEAGNFTMPKNEVPSRMFRVPQKSRCYVLDSQN